MKIKLKHELLLLNLFNVILIFIVVFWPSNFIRIILGIPFILFFPGYTTISALYPTKDAISATHRFILSFALSIAIIPLILLLLNYTSWGIKANPILYSVAAYVVIISGVAWIRRLRRSQIDRFKIEFNISIPMWKGFWKAGIANRIISIVLILAILGAIGILVYVTKMPDKSEKYTEFYILGIDGKTVDYPQSITLGETGKVIIGIINHEHAAMNYNVEVRINNLKNSETSITTVLDGAKWEDVIAFTPITVGINQKVEFLLYKSGEVSPNETLYLWVDVTQ